MGLNRWLLCETPAELPSGSGAMVFRRFTRDVCAEWLRRARVMPGTPFLLSPEFVHDVELNEFLAVPRCGIRHG